MEEQPLRCMDRELLPRLVHATREIAEFVGADRRNVVLVKNVTTGVNAVVRSMEKFLRKDEQVLYLSIAYGSVKKILSHYFKGRIIEIVVPLPISRQQVGIVLRFFLLRLLTWLQMRLKKINVKMEGLS